MRTGERAGSGPPVREALSSEPSGGRGVRKRRERGAAGGTQKGKPLETVGRKAIGTKATKGSERGERIRKIRTGAKSAWPLIIKSKPLETGGRKAKGAKAEAKPARPLIIISKPPEMTGRKAKGAKV